jgi:hypothetical protein
LSARSRSLALQQTIEALRGQAEAERTALLRQIQPAQVRLAQGVRSTSSLLRALALAVALAAGAGLIRRWLQPARAHQAYAARSAIARLLHWIRLGTAAAGAMRLLSARTPR